MIQQEIVVAKQQPEMRGGLNYIRKIYEKEMAAVWQTPEKHCGDIKQVIKLNIIRKVNIETMWVKSA
ncbi:MAG: hypothetical protein V2I33_17185 [Kangiellaceae bacterium]|jgi:hypothetical protein|nr:hypothetical protein [Kangiellaceae bacterium]